MRLYAASFVLMLFSISAPSLTIAKYTFREDDRLNLTSSLPEDSDLQKDSAAVWKTKWVLGLNGSQASYNNWSQGNANSIAATGSNFFNATFKRSKYSYDILINLKYGKAKINGAEVRKTDDLIAIKNRLDYMLHVKDVSAYFEADFRTQFDKGFDKNQVYISSFLAPATLLETAGLGYKPNSVLQFQSGLTMKQTFMADTSLARVYGLKTGSQFRNEGGFSMGAALKMNVAKNLVLNSSAQSFTNILRPLDETDIIFSNELTGKINSFMNTNIQFVMVYDKDFNTSLQIKQVLAVGLSFTVL